VTREVERGRESVGERVQTFAKVSEFLWIRSVDCPVRPDLALPRPVGIGLIVAAVLVISVDTLLVLQFKRYFASFG
jgi:hypothetical protein